MIVHDERKDSVPATIARMTPTELIFVGRGNSEEWSIFLLDTLLDGDIRNCNFF